MTAPYSIRYSPSSPEVWRYRGLLGRARRSKEAAIYAAIAAEGIYSEVAA